MAVMTRTITVVVWCTCLVTCASTQSIYITNNATSEKGKDVQLTCQLGLTMPWTSNVNIYRSDIQDIGPSHSVGVCYNTDCLRETLRVVPTSDGHNVFVNITNLDRNEDETYWTCRNIPISVQLFLTVYTSPTAAILTASVSHSHSLPDGPVILTCRTDRCTYKNPVFTWYIMMSNGTQHIFTHGVVTMSNYANSCNDSEKTYYSSLKLRENETFPGNLEMTGQFVCGISFPTLVDDLVSLPTNNVTFAVQVSSAQLFDDNQEMMDENQIIVTKNVQHSVTCKAGPSRPPSIYIFYIGTKFISESKNNTLMFIPNRNQHGIRIYCKAYNLQEPDNAVVSDKPLLFVNVPVTSVTMKDGVFEPDSCSVVNATEGSPKTLTCFAGESRPSSNFVWYIESQVRQNQTSNVFTFMPQMNDHGRNVYCTAYNLQGFQAVTSVKPRLYIVGRPVQPRIFIFTGYHGPNATFYWIARYNGGFKQWFILQYRKLVSEDWINNTRIEEQQNQDDMTSSDEYWGQLSFLAPGEYQARLVAGNTKGEAFPVDLRDRSFRIRTVAQDQSLSSQTPKSSSSSTAGIIGTVLGSLITILLGIIIVMCVWLKRKQVKDIPPSTIKLEPIPEPQVQPGTIYEELRTSAEPSKSTYDTLDSTNITRPIQIDPSSIDYENTALA